MRLSVPNNAIGPRTLSAIVVEGRDISRVTAHRGEQEASVQHQVDPVER